MAFLSGMTDRFWSYVSPRKTQQKRDKPFKVPPMPIRNKTPPKNAPMYTPESKIARWHIKTPSTSDSVDDTLLPPSPPTSAGRYTDYDGDTLIRESIEETLKINSDDEWDANEETMVVDDGKYMEEQKTINRDQERERRKLQGNELREAGWSEDSVFLFQKLGLRGFEPLLPESWVDDFNSLPVDLFTHKDEMTYIKSQSGNDYRAQLALSELFALGGYARDAVLTNAPLRTPEYHIRNAVKRYNRWALKDADLHHTWQDVSLFQTVTCSKDVPSYIAEQKMTRKLAKLHKKWSNAFEIYDRVDQGGNTLLSAPEEIPTLYGVIASYTIMAFVSYVPSTEPNSQGSLRMIATFDLGEEGYDVWNSLAVAIFVIHCRNRMNQLKDFLPEPTTVYERDPDI